MLFNLLIEDMNLHTAHFFHETRPSVSIVHRYALVPHVSRAQLTCVPFRSVDGAAGAPMTVTWSPWGVHVTRWLNLTRC